MFCPRSGTEQAQSTAEERKAKGSALILPATFADINITKADLYITGGRQLRAPRTIRSTFQKETSLWFP
jgi:hypothetical protein